MNAGGIVRIAACLIVSSFATLATAEAPAPLPSVTLPAPLARVLADYESAWQRKDAAALAALFTEDGFVLSSGHPTIRGRAEIARHYAEQGGPLALRALAFATDGRLGYVIGGFARAKDDPDIGKFTLTLRKSAHGQWMIVADMDNANTRRPAGTASTAPPGRVVFVCEHGSVKSVMAAQWFNRLAAERNVPFRAISRGVTPDAAIPPPVARNLAADGFDVDGFRPAPLESADVAGAARVVAIGVQSPLLAATPVTRWDDIPPASTDYAASRDAMRARMGALLDSLARAE